MILVSKGESRTWGSQAGRVIQDIEYLYRDLARPLFTIAHEIRFRFFPNTLCGCIKCGKIAEWFGPSDSEEDYCDDCVPRGCSCNVIDKNIAATLVIDPPDESGRELIWMDYGGLVPEQHRDERGRLLPCADYSYFRHGLKRWAQQKVG